ncbi:MAG: 3'-5' exonuclease [Dehalococcoidia bacterium]
MNLPILTDGFQRSLSLLTANQRGLAFDFVFKLADNPAHPSLSMERVRRAPDPHVWSARVSQGIRCILWRNGDAVFLLHVDKEEAAYQWAERRRVERHPDTGALQVVRTVEVTEALPVSTPTSPAADNVSLFAAHDDSSLRSLGVPLEWLPRVRTIDSLDGILALVNDLPAEAAERLWDLANGNPIPPVEQSKPNEDPLTHPDSRRRFFVPEDEDELRQMLDAPLATWMAFLHPTQRSLVERRFNGPAKVTGTAGTGKTVVAMHRARNLARQGRRVLLTTFGSVLTENIKRNLRLFCTADELALITVETVHGLTLRQILPALGEHVRPPDDNEVVSLIERFQRRLRSPLSAAFLRTEWQTVIQEQGIFTWEAYRAAGRAGRGRALSMTDRRHAWDVFERVHAALDGQHKMDWPDLCRRATELLAPRLVDRDAVRARHEAECAALDERQRPALVTRPVWDFDAVIVDEVQDLGAPEVRLLAALAGTGADRLMLIGDGGQRIYARRFSLRALGIEVRGRSATLRINYRTTEQIRRFADRLVPVQGDDLDGGKETRGDCRSLIAGPEPFVRGFRGAADQYAFIVERIAAATTAEHSLDEIAVFARTNSLLNALKQVLDVAGIRTRRLAQPVLAGDPPAVTLATMHSAKGLEFKAVFVADASDDRVPLPATYLRLEEPQDIEEVMTRERNLLYVCLTRAREEAFLTWTGTPSRFIVPTMPGIAAGSSSPSNTTLDEETAQLPEQPC